MKFTHILQRMRQEVEAVNLCLRLSMDLRLISTKQYANAFTLTASIGKQATGWLRHSQRPPVAGVSRHAGQRAPANYKYPYQFNFLIKSSGVKFFNFRK